MRGWYLNICFIWLFNFHVWQSWINRYKTLLAHIENSNLLWVLESISFSFFRNRTPFSMNGFLAKMQINPLNWVVWRQLNIIFKEPIHLFLTIDNNYRFDLVRFGLVTMPTESHKQINISNERFRYNLQSNCIRFWNEFYRSSTHVQLLFEHFTSTHMIKNSGIRLKAKAFIGNNFSLLIWREIFIFQMSKMKSIQSSLIFRSMGFSFSKCFCLSSKM